MSSNLYNVLSIFDSVLQTYQESQQERYLNSNRDNINDSKENITYIRNILNVRNINNNYDNNRNILSNIVTDSNMSNMISLFITNYMENRDEENRNEENRNEENRNEENKNEENKDIKLNECRFCELNDETRKNNENCSICFEIFKDNEIVNITYCNHIYHNNCITEWIKINKTCPLCREYIL
jgi:hypothetical protein